MGELGDLLELLHNAHSRVTTFEVEYRDWGRRLPSTELTVVASADGRPKLNWRGGGPWSEQVIRTRRIWLERPHRMRVEILENEILVRLGVRDREGWWIWDAQEGTTNGLLMPDEEGFITLPPTLAPPVLTLHRMLATLRFEPTGVGERAGRPVMRARARPREQLPARSEFALELELDAEHGSLLRRVDFEDGERVWDREAHQVIYDSHIDPECFVFSEPSP
jgi:hypothetical protein